MPLTKWPDKNVQCGFSVRRWSGIPWMFGVRNSLTTSWERCRDDGFTSVIGRDPQKRSPWGENASTDSLKFYNNIESIQKGFSISRFQACSHTIANAVTVHARWWYASISPIITELDVPIHAARMVVEWLAALLELKPQRDLKPTNWR